MVAMMPVARLILGKSLGNGSVIVTLIIAAAPYIARMVELLCEGGPQRGHRGRPVHGLHQLADRVARAAARGQAVPDPRLGHRHRHRFGYTAMAATLAAPAWARWPSSMVTSAATPT